MRKQFAASEMSAAWIAELRRYAAALAADPTHRESWLWRIRIKVLMYLIWRYGEDPYLDVKGYVPPIAVSSRLPSSHRSSNPPRSRAEMRGILDRIAELNRFKMI